MGASHKLTVGTLPAIIVAMETGGGIRFTSPSLPPSSPQEEVFNVLYRLNHTGPGLQSSLYQLHEEDRLSYNIHNIVYYAIVLCVHVTN